ncbi:hypothetical protein AHF37_04309 [Paragonimus kellicotti]|nr:hypothetical protein AHF37_04309 [Paragonimus kellicotti]
MNVVISVKCSCSSALSPQCDTRISMCHCRIAFPSFYIPAIPLCYNACSICSHISTLYRHLTHQMFCENMICNITLFCFSIPYLTSNMSTSHGNSTRTLTCFQTSSKPGTTTTGPNQIDSFMCNRSASTAEMTTTKSTLNVNCVQLGLIGLNEVQCAVTGRQYSNHTPTRHVYVLCPGGERPLELTSGEVVGIAVGAAIALILTFIGCVILRNSRKDSPLPFTGHFLGQRV